MNKKIIAIIVIIVIVIVIVGIWVFKNYNKIKNENIENDVVITNQTQNEDFKLNITSKFSLEKLKLYNLPIIIDFGSDSCLSCKEIGAVLKQLNGELQGKAIIRFVDVWKYPYLANGYPIELIPTQIFINSDGTPYAPKNAEALGIKFITDKNGNHIFSTHMGVLTVEEMKEMLKEMGLNE